MNFKVSGHLNLVPDFISNCRGRARDFAYLQGARPKLIRDGVPARPSNAAGRQKIRSNPTRIYEIRHQV